MVTTSDGAAAVFEGRRRRVAAVDATRQQLMLCGHLGRARNVIDDVLPDFAKISLWATVFYGAGSACYAIHFVTHILTFPR